MFDWRAFLSSNRIAYVSSGPNVSKGSVAIHCPYCGSADPSEHLVIRLNGKGWFCWRNKLHRGGSPVRLVATLLGCSFEQAAKLTGYTQYLPPSDFLGAVKALLYPKDAKEDQRVLEFPEEFHPLRVGSGRLYWNYLFNERGFDNDDIAAMTREYDIHYCMRGAYSRRIIFLVYNLGKLVGWTGRSVDRTAFIRYRTLSQEKEKAEKEGYEPAIGPINDYLLWYDDLIEESENDPSLTLMLCEGPMDGLKVNILGRKHGIRATCLFTSSPTPSQMELLYELVPRFKRSFLFLDRGMQHQAMRLQAELRALAVEVAEPPGKDPGDLRTSRELCSIKELRMA
jgi:hypothetical protein